MVGANGLLVGRLEQAVDLAPVVVVQLELADAELVAPSLAGVLGDLSDCLLRQLQIRIDVIAVLRAASGDFSIEHVRGVG